jgi:hypothetical protein
MEQPSGPTSTAHQTHCCTRPGRPVRRRRKVEHLGCCRKTPCGPLPSPLPARASETRFSAIRTLGRHRGRSPGERQHGQRRLLLAQNRISKRPLFRPCFIARKRENEVARRPRQGSSQCSSPLGAAETAMESDAQSDSNTHATRSGARTGRLAIAKGLWHGAAKARAEGRAHRAVSAKMAAFRRPRCAGPGDSPKAGGDIPRRA